MNKTMNTAPDNLRATAEKLLVLAAVLAAASGSPFPAREAAEGAARLLALAAGRAAGEAAAHLPHAPVLIESAAPWALVTPDLLADLALRLEGLGSRFGPLRAEVIALRERLRATPNVKVAVGMHILERHVTPKVAA